MLTYYKTILIATCLLVTCSNGTRGIGASISEQLEENDSPESILSINKSPGLDDNGADQLDVKLQEDESPATALSTTPYPLTSSTTKKSRSPVRKLVSFIFRTTTKKPKTTKTTKPPLFTLPKRTTRPPLFTLPKRTTRPPLFTFKTTKASTTKTTKTTKPTTAKTTKTSTIKTTKTTKPPLITLPPILQTTTKAPLIIRTTTTTTFPTTSTTTAVLTTSTTTTVPTTPTTTVSTVQSTMSSFSSTLTSTDPSSSSTLRTNEIQTISTNDPQGSSVTSSLGLQTISTELSPSSVSTNRPASSEATAPNTNPATASAIASKSTSWATGPASTTNVEEHQSTTVPQPVPSSHLFGILMITSGIVVSAMIIVIPCVYYKFLSARLYQTKKKPYIEKEPEFNELKI